MPYPQPSDPIDESAAQVLGVARARHRRLAAARLHTPVTLELTVAEVLCQVERCITAFLTRKHETEAHTSREAL